MTRKEGVHAGRTVENQAGEGERRGPRDSAGPPLILPGGADRSPVDELETWATSRCWTLGLVRCRALCRPHQPRGGFDPDFKNLTVRSSYRSRDREQPTKGQLLDVQFEVHGSLGRVRSRDSSDADFPACEARVCSPGRRSELGADVGPRGRAPRGEPLPILHVSERGVGG